MPRFSFNTWNHSATWGIPPSLPEQIQGTAQAGYDYVGLDVPSLLAHEQQGLRPEAITEQLAGHGISCFELVPLSLSGDEGRVAESLSSIGRLAAIIKPQQVLAVARGDITPSLVDNTRRCAQVLADLGVGVAIEFLPSIELNSVDSIQRLIDAVDDTGTRVMVDSWHFFAGPSTWESLEGLPPARLGFVQFSDALPPISDDVVHEYLYRRALPGEGVHELQRFADVVLTKDPTVTVSVEVLSGRWRERPPAELAAAAFDATKRFWADRPEAPN